MLRFVPALVAIALTTLPTARDAAASESPRGPDWLFQAAGGLVVGTLAGGAAVYAANRLEFNGATLMSLRVAFSIGAGLGVWGTGSFRGFRASALGTIFAAVGSVLLVEVLVLAIDDRDASAWATVATPLIAVGSGLLGFAATEGDAGCGGEMFVRRAVADERSR